MIVYWWIGIIVFIFIILLIATEDGNDAHLDM